MDDKFLHFIVVDKKEATELLKNPATVNGDIVVECDISSRGRLYTRLYARQRDTLVNLLVIEGRPDPIILQELGFYTYCLLLDWSTFESTLAQIRGARFTVRIDVPEY